MQQRLGVNGAKRGLNKYRCRFSKRNGQLLNGNLTLNEATKWKKRITKIWDKSIVVAT